MEGTAGRAWLPNPPQQPWATGIPWGTSMPQPLGDKHVIKLIPGFAVMSGASREGSVISWPDGWAEGSGRWEGGVRGAVDCGRDPELGWPRYPSPQNSSDPGRAHWSNSGGLMIHLPSGETGSTPHNVLTPRSLSTSPPQGSLLPGCVEDQCGPWGGGSHRAAGLQTPPQRR